MDCYLCVACLSRLHNPRSIERIVTPDGSTLSVCDRGYDCEPRRSPTLSPELSRGHTRWPSRGPQMMVVAGRMGQLWVIVLQLSVSMVDEQVIEQLLVIWASRC